MIADDLVPLSDDKAFDVRKHKKELFGMFTGNEEKVSFVIDGSMLDVVFSKFGSDVKLRKIDDNYYSFTAEVQVSPIFFGWCCAFGERLKVVSPDNVIEKIKEHVKTISNLYE